MKAALLSLAVVASATSMFASAAAPGVREQQQVIPTAPEGARRLWSEEVIPPPPHWFHSEPPFPINLLCPLPASGNITYYEWVYNGNIDRRLEVSEAMTQDLRKLTPTNGGNGGYWEEISSTPIIGGRICIKDLYIDRYGHLLVNGCIRYRATNTSGEIVKCFFWVPAQLLLNPDSQTCDELTLILGGELYLVGLEEAYQTYLELEPIHIPITSVPGTGNIQGDLLCILAQLLAMQEHYSPPASS